MTLKNTGSVLGKEVVQLYIKDLFASVTRPVRELKGFELVELSPGESKSIQFTLTDKELGFFTNEGEWVVENGDFEVYVGGSSATTHKADFELK